MRQAFIFALGTMVLLANGSTQTWAQASVCQGIAQQHTQRLLAVSNQMMARGKARLAAGGKSTDAEIQQGCVDNQKMRTINQEMQRDLLQAKCIARIKPQAPAKPEYRASCARVGVRI